MKISIRQFFIKGSFGEVTPGQTKEDILSFFPAPDDESDVSKDLSIWRYGNIEFHFENNVLFLIFCDYIDIMTGGKSLKLSKWFLSEYEKLDIISVIKEFNLNRMNFKLTHDGQEPAEIKLTLESGVVLHFRALDDNTNDNINRYHLTAFALSGRDNTGQQSFT